MSFKPVCYVFLAMLPLAVFMIGCKPVASNQSATEGESGGHQHAAGDELVWPLKEKIADTDIEIWLGHHGDHFHAGEEIEPAIAILKKGVSLDSAKVFVGVVRADNAEEVLGEVPTVYEPETEDEPAHYAQGELSIPDGVSDFSIRYRMVIPGVSEDVVRDVAVKTAH